VVSSRKSGMTVLGKVPKPINLPSQRLENHGLDPNVEIVPKGTLTWGSRPSSAASNAWASSTILSPKTDGSAGSPSHFNDRPTSGGSGTRPSTAGSEKSSDPSSVWGSNSRPSSASGLLASSYTSVAANRPRSAETRPGSSHLSRFAESSSENTVAWGSTRTPEKLGSMPSKNTGFTLSSGDFPTLGSEKNSESHVQRGHSSQGRSTSGSGIEATSNEGLETPTGGDGSVNVNILKTGKYSPAGGNSPQNKSWQREPQQPQPQPQPYPILGMPPQQIDTWRPPPPTHPPDTVWYRGAPLGGPFRPAIPPPGEPYMYYPQFQPNFEAAPRPGVRQGGYHPNNNGETYRPHLAPNTFMVPSYYGSPQAPVPYAGYYGTPQAGFGNAGEKEVSFQGGLSEYPNQNDKVNPEHIQTRTVKHEPLMNKEQKESDQPHGQYRVLLKQHDASGNSHHAQERKDRPLTPNLLHTDQKGLLKEPGKCEERPSNNVSKKQPEYPSQTDEGILSGKPKTTISTAHDHQTVTKKNATLIEKIEVLNHKARSSEAHSEVGQALSKDDKMKQSKVLSSQTDHPTVAESQISAADSNVHRASNATRRTQDSDSKESHDASVSEAPASLDLSIDYQAQRTKMKEIAVQRAKQLQQEEEERTREQKAKALAKLEELNRRSAAAANQKKLNDPFPENDDTTPKQEAKAENSVRESQVGILPVPSAKAKYTELKNVEAPTELPLDKAPISSEAVSDESAVSHDSRAPRHKQMAYRKRPNAFEEKNQVEKPIISNIMDNTKNLIDSKVQTPAIDNVPNSEDLPMQQKKRGNRNLRSKNKLDDAIASSSLPSLAPPTDEKTEKVSFESNKIPSQELIAETKMVNQSNHSKSQAFRRTTRNQQGARPVDKIHGSEAVIWAPVNKHPETNEQSEESKQINTNITSIQSNEKVGDDMHASVKTKRAEMERYVPKPVAKELLQQENSQKLSSDAKNVEKGIAADVSVAAKADSNLDTKTGEENNKPVNKRGRKHASWRQRNPAETARLSNSDDNLVDSDSVQHVHKSSDQHQLHESDGQEARQLKSDGWSTTDTNLLPTEPPAVKDQGVGSKQRWQQIKVNKAGGSNYTESGNHAMESGTGDNTQTRTPASDLNLNSKSENKYSSSEHAKSHWKPKSQAYPQSHQEKNRRNKEHSGESSMRHSENESNLAPKGDVNDIRSEAKVENPSEEQIHKVQQDASTKAPTYEAAQSEHQFNPAQRRNSRFSRGQEVIYRGREANFSTNGDKRKSNAHFEYQPVGSYSKPAESSRPNPNPNFDEAVEGNPHFGSRYRGRGGQSHSRRGGGHFVRRGGGPAVDNEN
ncbi:Protein MODIFIER OF SNC1 1, partial [Ananas comosus]